MYLITIMWHASYFFLLYSLWYPLTPAAKIRQKFDSHKHIFWEKGNSILVQTNIIMKNKQENKNKVLNKEEINGFHQETIIRGSCVWLCVCLWWWKRKKHVISDEMEKESDIIKDKQKFVSYFRLKLHPWISHTLQQQQKRQNMGREEEDNVDDTTFLL